jgi:hypothetical protein
LAFGKHCWEAGVMPKEWNCFEIRDQTKLEKKQELLDVFGEAASLRSTTLPESCRGMQRLKAHTFLCFKADSISLSSCSTSDSDWLPLSPREPHDFQCTWLTRHWHEDWHKNLKWIQIIGVDMCNMCDVYWHVWLFISYLKYSKTFKKLTPPSLLRCSTSVSFAAFPKSLLAVEQMSAMQALGESFEGAKAGFGWQ